MKQRKKRRTNQMTKSELDTGIDTGIDAGLDTGIEEFLARLGTDLERHPWMSRWRTESVLDEIRSHLADSAAALEHAGLQPARAAREALERFGKVKATSLALTQLNDRWTLMLLKLTTGAAATLTSLMAGAILILPLAQGAGLPQWDKIGVATFVLLAGVATLAHLFIKPLGKARMLWLGGGLLALGLLVTAVSSWNVFTGPDPEYWVVMLGMLLTGQALGLLLGLLSARFQTA